MEREREKARGLKRWYRNLRKKLGEKWRKRKRIEEGEGREGKGRGGRGRGRRSEGGGEERGSGGGFVCA